MEVLHIGSYGKNLGDNIALSNVRKSFLQHRSDLTFVPLEISTFWEDKNNPDAIIKRLNAGKHKAIVLGGGGLIEFESYSKMRTNQKLPLTKQILEKVEKPVILYGIGVNSFRGEEEWPEKTIKTLQEIIDNSALFSVRNDGSLEKLKKLGINTSKVYEIPDPGLLHFEQKEESYNLEKGVFQPARNGSVKINKFRFKDDTQEVLNLPVTLNIPFFPHTIKDYGFKGDFVFDDNNFRTKVKYKFTNETLQKYYEYDYVVAMRGHGQLITVGMNIPGIYFSTQDKVFDFSAKNNYEDYTVDISNSSWKKELTTKIDKLKEDVNFLQKWYLITKNNRQRWIDLDNNFVEKCIEVL
jgi:polysaccharide pyruvyl transferase WcaK-like protein